MATKRSESSRHEKRIAASEIFSAPLTSQQRARLKKAAAKPDAEIDYSDAPEVKNPSSIVVGRFYRPVKQLVSFRIDADVLDWFKRQGEGYQTRMNQVLRREMESAARK